MTRFKHVKRVPVLVVAFSVVALTVAAFALADVITGDANSITSNIDSSVEKAPGSSGSGLFGLVVASGVPAGDPNGCNAGTGGSKPPVVLAVSSNQPWLTLTQSTVTVTDCDDADPGLQDAATVNFQVGASAPAGATAVVTATYQSGGVAGGKYQDGSFEVKTPAAPPDTTAPTSSASAKNADLTAYTFGTWTNQDVTVTLSGQDESGGSGLKEIRYTTNGSDPTASSGTVYSAPFSISAQGTTTVKWRAIDNLGNLEAVHSETVKIDKVAPTITDLGATAAPNGDNGWYTTNVTNQFKAEDTVSGLSAACDAAFDQPGDIKNVTISAEGAAVKGASGSCADNAGNTAASKDSAAFMIDKSTPTSSASAKNADLTAYTFGSWTNQDVTVTLTGQDSAGGSGLRQIRYTTDGSDPTASSGTVYSAPFTISAQGTTTVKWRAIDDAGNLEAVHSETVKIDKVAPTITDLGATAAPNGDNGWYTTNVTNQFKAEDTVSGLSAACDAAFDQPGDIKNVTISAEGAAVKGGSGSCTDNAGNMAASIDSAAFMIDKTAPVVAVTGVTNGASYTVGSVPAAGCSTSDGVSGVQTLASLTQTGGPVGSITATCSGGEDNAGNTAAAVSATYSILFAFNGFYQPIDMGTVFNKAKAGSAIPVKFSLDGAPQPGSNTPGLGGASSAFAPGTAANPNPVAVLVGCPSASGLFDLVEEVSADSNSGLKYDPTADQWVYVWKTTTAVANSCRQLKVTLADGTTQTANFQFTK